MSSIPLFHYQINTNNISLIGNILEKDKFIPQSTPSTYLKSNIDCNIQIDLSQSFPSPSIICCCSTVSTSLPQLLSSLNQNHSSIINLILFIESSDRIDWNPLINLTAVYNLSLNVVNNENDLNKKLCNIINNLVKPNIKKKSVPNNNNQSQNTQVKQMTLKPSPAEITQVKQMTLKPSPAEINHSRKTYARYSFIFARVVIFSNAK